MTIQNRVCFQARTSLPFEQTIERCREILAQKGFGVLTEIDVQATFKKKLDVDRDPYVILGACHPPSAYRAVTAVPEIGVLLPCNVTVSVEEGQTVVRAMDPNAVLDLIDHPVVQQVANEVGVAMEGLILEIEAVEAVDTGVSE